MTLSVRTLLVSAIALCAGTGAQAKVTFSLDYSLDNAGGLFDPNTTDGQNARAAMLRATQVFSDRIVDNLTAITPGGGNTWSPRVVNPGTGLEVTPALTGVGAGAIKVYVGSRSLGATEIGLATAGTAVAGGSQAFVDNAGSRGQAGALSTPKTDYGPWGGSIAFDWDANWYFGLTPGGLTSNKVDLYSIAVHELAHLLGFSISQPSYAALVSGGKFNGAKARAANGGAAPSVDGSHWLGMSSTVGAGGPAQVALMDAGLPSGVRRRVTLLDWAALDDAGWSLAIPGDADANGVVNFTDFQILERGFRETNSRWSHGDFNEDGTVDTADFMLLYRNYGLRADGSAVPVSAAEMASLDGLARAWGVEVPEPTGLTLALTGLALVVTRRRGR